MVIIQTIFTNVQFYETLKDIFNTLQNLKLVQLRIDEIAGV